LSFEVACPVEHGFSIWTNGTATWWPRDRTGWNAVLPRFIAALATPTRGEG
jgi:hypothetical protein